MLIFIPGMSNGPINTLYFEVVVQIPEKNICAHNLVCYSTESIGYYLYHVLRGAVSTQSGQWFTFHPMAERYSVTQV